MLSAVAARKARLAQAQTQASPVVASEPKPPSSSPSPAPPPHPAPKNKPAQATPAPLSHKPPSKRKLSTSAGDPPKPKKTKDRHRRVPQKHPARYFAQEDAFGAQDDVIVVDESDNESSAQSSSPTSEEESLRMRSSRGLTKGNRPWSPSAPFRDSSDEDEGLDEDEDSGDEHVLDNPHPPAVLLSQPSKVLSTFHPGLNQNVFVLPLRHAFAGEPPQPKSVILLLNATETVALLGAYTLTVLRGAVALAGVSITASSTAHTVFAPRSSPLPIIQCTPRAASSQPSSTSVLPANIDDAALGCDAVIMLQEVHSGVDGLGRICRTFDGFFAPSRWHRNQARFDLGLDGVYFLPLQTPDIAPLAIPPTWTTATDAVLSRSDENAEERRCVCLVKGPKNAGKSTFARFLLNKLLSRYRRVAYLECDLGQSEFTPGGMVSLNVIEQPVFGPPFTHPSVPFAAHYVGATSPRSSPSHYLESVQALLQQYDVDVQDAPLDEGRSDEADGRVVSHIPLVVNTMGWTKGLGADLTRKVEDIVGPTDVFTLVAGSSSDDQNNGCMSAAATTQAHSAPGPRVHVLDIVSSVVAAYYTAADHRNVSIMSYFHATFPQGPPSSPYASLLPTSWNTSIPLCAQPPYEVDCQVAVDRVILTGAGMEDVVPQEVHRALNCAVVGLISCDPGTSTAETPLEGTIAPALPYEQGALPPLPSTSRCVGLALVRAVSPPPRNLLQIITPVPPSLLHSARVLVMGELQLPVWGMLDFRTLDDGAEIAGYERAKVPYLRWGKGEGVGGERRRVRRNLMRKGQL
ncbi:hypothetical protein BD414DRAFT_417604 [Trametes punicea]|nr:hypothetical protein BD414DRAFT_417604 [Trametes punicea]